MILCNIRVNELKVNVQSKCIEKYKFEISSKYDREHDFDVKLGSVVPCRKLRWISCKHLNDVVCQVEIPGKSTILSREQIYFRHKR